MIHKFEDMYLPTLLDEQDVTQEQFLYGFSLKKYLKKYI